MLHVDVLIVLLNDLNKQAAAGNISAAQFAELAEPLNSNLLMGLAEQHRALIKQKIESNRSLTEMKSQLSELQIQQRNNQESYILDLERYEAFLKLKGLSDEFDEWEFEQIGKGMEADRDG